MTALIRPMRGRDRTEAHRAATPLELFFDLTFVVGVAFAAEGLARQIEEGHTGHGVFVYLLVFFAIWWGWLNFTWFASAFDTDDWWYRLVTLGQMAGALVVAAGVPRAMEHEDFAVITAGYVVMRLALVSQWLRVARSDPRYRETALRYAGGITMVQIVWVVRLFLPGDLALVAFLLLVVLELAVPMVAEHHASTPFHLRHIAERFGLFTLIVLGEGVLEAARSISEAVDGGGEHVVELVVLGVCGLIILAGMWWTYFAYESFASGARLRTTFAWGYSHYVVFAAAGAVSAGLALQVRRIDHEGADPDVASALTLAVPVAVFTLVVWLLIDRTHVSRRLTAVGPVAAALMIAVAALPIAPLAVAALVAAAVTGVVVVVVLAREVPA